MEARKKKKKKEMEEIKKLLEKLSKRLDLTEKEAQFAIETIASEYSHINAVQIGILLALLAAKGETPLEVATFVKHMRQQAIPVHVKVSIIIR
jgi:anthranilate phosphoribosyltransferase